MLTKLFAVTIFVLCLVGAGLAGESQEDSWDADPSVVARDAIESEEDYTTVSISSVAAEMRGDEFGLTPQAGTRYFSHSATGGMRDADTTLTNGFESGHLLQSGLYLAHIHVGRGLLQPSRVGYSTMDFRLVTLDGDEIGEAKRIDPYDPPGEGEWSMVSVVYIIDQDNPRIGERITWSARIRHYDPYGGFFGALDNVIVRHFPGEVVAADEMLDVGDYTVQGVARGNRDPSGSYGVEATAGFNYIRYGGRYTASRTFSLRLTDGFVSGHTVQPGTYTAMIDLGRAGEVLGRDSFGHFDFMLLTLGGEEIGVRTVLKPYIPQPDFGQWTAAIVSYTIGPGDPVIGERLTWGAEAGFSSSGVGKFGAIDNVVVYFRPYDGGGEAEVARRQRILEISERIRSVLTEDTWEVTIERRGESRSYSLIAKPPKFFAILPEADPGRFGIYVRPSIWSNDESLIIRMEASGSGRTMDAYQRGNSPDSFLQLLDSGVWRNYPALRVAIETGVSQSIGILHPETLLETLERAEFQGNETVDDVECYVFQDTLRPESEGASLPLPMKLYFAVEPPHLPVKIAGVIGETETTFDFLDWRVGRPLSDDLFQPGEALSESQRTGSIADALQAFLSR